MIDDKRSRTPNLAWLTIPKIPTLKKAEHRFSALSMCIDLDLNSPLARAIALSLDVLRTRRQRVVAMVISPPLSRVGRIAAALSVPVAELLRGPEEGEPRLLR